MDLPKLQLVRALVNWQCTELPTHGPRFDSQYELPINWAQFDPCLIPWYKVYESPLLIVMVLVMMLTAKVQDVKPYLNP